MFVYTYGGDANSFNDGEAHDGWLPHSYAYGGRITFPSAGTVDQLGFYGRWASLQGGRSVKIALYDASGNLVVSASIPDIPVTETMEWYDSAPFTPVAVSAGDYFILYS